MLWSVAGELRKLEGFMPRIGGKMLTPIEGKPFELKQK
jgi:hypothetical protein